MITILILMAVLTLAALGLLPKFIKGVFKAVGMIVFYWIVAVVCGLAAGAGVWFLGRLLLGI